MRAPYDSSGGTFSPIGATEGMAELDYRILGSLEACRRGAPLPRGPPKQRALMARLLLEANRFVSTDRLIADLWSGRPPGRPQTAVQGYVSDLRKVLEPERRPDAPFAVLRTEGRGYLLTLEPDQLDLHRFERLVATGKAELA